MVSHGPRAHLTGRSPVHVTMRVLSEIPSLRSMGKAIRGALRAGAGQDEKAEFRVVHFAILSNHIHLLAEGDSAQALSRGMKGLAVRIAWAVNRALGRKRGKVFSDRFHSRVLSTPREVNRALLYVMNNYRRHLAQDGRTLPPEFRDQQSSAIYWKRNPRSNPFPQPKTWVLRTGYLLGGGEIDLRRTPGRIPKPKPPAKPCRSV
jgi:REP element-mobilizing transposase RayT